VSGSGREAEGKTQFCGPDRDRKLSRVTCQNATRERCGRPVIRMGEGGAIVL